MNLETIESSKFGLTPVLEDLDDLRLQSTVKKTQVDISSSKVEQTPPPGRRAAEFIEARNLTEELISQGHAQAHDLEELKEGDTQEWTPFRGNDELVQQEDSETGGEKSACKHLLAQFAEHSNANAAAPTLAPSPLVIGKSFTLNTTATLTSL